MRYTATLHALLRDFEEPVVLTYYLGEATDTQFAFASDADCQSQS
jgi:hypothetical protein